MLLSSSNTLFRKIASQSRSSNPRKLGTNKQHHLSSQTVRRYCAFHPQGRAPSSGAAVDSKVELESKISALDSDTQYIFQELRKGSRRALSKSITLVESSLREDQERKNKLVECILAERSISEKQGKFHSFRIGLSGSPGVGKSTFIESFGLNLLARGYKIAVLAVDPSSTRTGGSILGDKTRMTELSKRSEAYIRPSPSRGTLGGVTSNTNETILLLEEAGYDVIIIETVGVGQSEVAVESMVDMFVMLANPAAGDELQGIKKGIVEIADMIVVNKADGDLIPKARQAQFEYMSALKYSVPKNPIWRPRVLACSAISGTGLDDVWDTMYDYWRTMEELGELGKKRQAQRKNWMWRLVHDELEYRLSTSLDIQNILPDIESRVKKGDIAPAVAADDILYALFGTKYKPQK